MSIAQLPPAQFDFFKFWLDDFKSLRNKPGIRAGLDRITEEYLDIAQFKYEEHREHDPEQAKLELGLDSHIAQVMVRDIFWLQQTFEGINLYPLSLAIAEQLYPGREWEVIECDFRAVVTDAERSQVFDIKNFSRLSGGASLASVGDTVYRPTNSQLRECNEFMEQLNRRQIEVIELMKRHLEEAKTNRTLTEFPQPAPKS